MPQNAIAAKKRRGRPLCDGVPTSGHPTAPPQVRYNMINITIYILNINTSSHRKSFLRMAMPSPWPSTKPPSWFLTQWATLSFPSPLFLFCDLFFPNHSIYINARFPTIGRETGCSIYSVVSSALGIDEIILTDNVTLPSIDPFKKYYNHSGRMELFREFHSFITDPHLPSPDLSGTHPFLKSSYTEVCLVEGCTRIARAFSV